MIVECLPFAFASAFQPSDWALTVGERPQLEKKRYSSVKLKAQDMKLQKVWFNLFPIPTKFLWNAYRLSFFETWNCFSDLSARLCWGPLGIVARHLEVHQSILCSSWIGIVIESFCRSVVLSFHTFLFCCRKVFISVLVRYFWRPEAAVDLPLSMGSQVQEPACHFGFMWAAFLAVKVRVTFYSPLLTQLVSKPTLSQDKFVWTSPETASVALLTFPGLKPSMARQSFTQIMQKCDDPLMLDVFAFCQLFWKFGNRQMHPAVRRSLYLSLGGLARIGLGLSTSASSVSSASAGTRLLHVPARSPRTLVFGKWEQSIQNVRNTKRASKQNQQIMHIYILHTGKWLKKEHTYIDVLKYEN